MSASNTGRISWKGANTCRRICRLRIIDSCSALLRSALLAHMARSTIMRFVSCAIVLIGAVGAGAAEPKVNFLRVPDRGIQPQVQVDGNGAVHLIYFKGDPGHSDLFYTHFKPGEQPARPLRVNSHPGSAIAIGNIRAAH